MCSVLWGNSCRDFVIRCHQDVSYRVEIIDRDSFLKCFETLGTTVSSFSSKTHKDGSLPALPTAQLCRGRGMKQSGPLGQVK